MERVYSSSLNGAAFLLFELKQVVKLKNQGLLPKEIRSIVQKENVFQFDNKGRITRTLPSVMRRLEAIDSVLGKMMIDGSVEDQKALNLYAIMKSDILFHEFMDEVIRMKFEVNDYVLEKKELNLFFTEKAEQSERVASWSESNLERLKSSYMLVLIEGGIINDRKSMQLNRLLVNDQVKDHLRHNGDSHYIEAMGG